MHHVVGHVYELDKLVILTYAIVDGPYFDLEILLIFRLFILLWFFFHSLFLLRDDFENEIV